MDSSQDQSRYVDKNPASFCSAGTEGAMRDCRRTAGYLGIISFRRAIHPTYKTRDLGSLNATCIESIQLGGRTLDKKLKGAALLFE